MSKKKTCVGNEVETGWQELKAMNEIRKKRG